MPARTAGGSSGQAVSSSARLVSTSRPPVDCVRFASGRVGSCVSPVECRGCSESRIAHSHSDAAVSTDTDSQEQNARLGPRVVPVCPSKARPHRTCPECRGVSGSSGEAGEGSGCAHGRDSMEESNCALGSGRGQRFRWIEAKMAKRAANSCRRRRGSSAAILECGTATAAVGRRIRKKHQEPCGEGCA